MSPALNPSTGCLLNSVSYASESIRIGVSIISVQYRSDDGLKQVEAEEMLDNKEDVRCN